MFLFLSKLLFVVYIVNCQQEPKHTHKHWNPFVNCSNCPETRFKSFYETRNCTAHNQKICNDCPLYYFCPSNDFHNETEISGCNYFGKIFGIREKVITGNPCEHCVCLNEGDNEQVTKPRIHCSFIQCPDAFDFSLRNPNVPEYKDCYYSYTKDECCGKLVCTNKSTNVETSKNLTVCKYRESEFKIGQKIYPLEDTCKICICDEQWNEKAPLESPSCFKVKCPYTQSEIDKIGKGCIPVFEEHSCCPSDYICPAEKLNNFYPIKLNLTSNDEESKCYFKNENFPIGSVLATRDPCAICSCIVPPYLTCEKTYCAYSIFDSKPVYEPNSCCEINSPQEKWNESMSILRRPATKCLQPYMYQLYYKLFCAVKEWDTVNNCPLSFDCPVSRSFTQEQLSTHCLVNNDIYSVDLAVPTLDKCEECFCRKENETSKPKVVCKYIHCPYSRLKEQTCYITRPLNNCCSNVTCPNEEQLMNMHVCEYDRRKYKYGESIFPNECTRCICNENWNKSLGELNRDCEILNCPLSTFDLTDKRDCLPIYNRGSCCPSDYFCPKPSDIPRSLTDCLYNGVNYPMDSKLKLPGDVDCICSLPPTFSCTRKAKPVKKDIPASCESCLNAKYLAHYVAKGCKPIMNEECLCPVRFECPEENKIDQKTNVCLYKNKTYAIGEEFISDDPCITCHCSINDDDGKTAKIDCIYVECPEIVFGYSAIPKDIDSAKLDMYKHCYFAYNDSDCCGTRHCPTEEEYKQTKKCVYKDKIYQLGEKYYPEENNCVVCTCNEDHDPNHPLHSKGCKVIDCFSNPVNIQEMKDGCVPVYTETGCCPIDYFCGRNASVNLDEQSKNFCKFKDRYYPIGSRLETDHKCRKCECKVPPDFTCISQTCPSPPSSECVIEQSESNACCPKYIC